MSNHSLYCSSWLLLSYCTYVYRFLQYMPSRLTSFHLNHQSQAAEIQPCVSNYDCLTVIFQMPCFTTCTTGTLIKASEFSELFKHPLLRTPWRMISIAIFSDLIPCMQPRKNKSRVVGCITLHNCMTAKYMAIKVKADAYMDQVLIVICTLHADHQDPSMFSQGCCCLLAPWAIHISTPPVQYIPSLYPYLNLFTWGRRYL